MKKTKEYKKKLQFFLFLNNVFFVSVSKKNEFFFSANTLNV